jgi:hypothetical protein
VVLDKGPRKQSWFPHVIYEHWSVESNVSILWKITKLVRPNYLDDKIVKLTKLNWARP